MVVIGVKGMLKKLSGSFLKPEILYRKWYQTYSNIFVGCAIIDEILSKSISV